MTQIIIGGDVCPVGRCESLLNRREIEAVFNGFVKTFNDADLTIVNLECPLINHPSPIKEKRQIFGATGHCAEALRKTGIDVVGLANNHIMDHGLEGFRSTINALKNAEIDYVGAGENLSAAKQIMTREVNQLQIGIIAIAEHEFSIASKKTAGANPLDIIEFVRNIRLCKNAMDLLIVLYHGGKELYPYPSPGQMNICRFMIEQGANVVICQHSHCPGCYEHYLEGFIVYGQGNLLFDTYPDKMPNCWYEGFLVNLSLEQNGRLKFSVIPYIQSRSETGINKYGNQCSELLHEVEKRSNQIKDDEFVKRSWLEFCNNRRYEYLGYIRGCNKLLNYINKKLHLTDYLYSKHAHNLMLNTIRCETHREILETVLNRTTHQEKGKL